MTTTQEFSFDCEIKSCFTEWSHRLPFRLLFYEKSDPDILFLIAQKSEVLRLAIAFPWGKHCRLWERIEVDTLT